MCGIAGVFYTDRDRRPEPGIIETMTSRLKHRGPDDEAFYINSGFGLGFRRLSIIDIEGGRQPFVSDDGRIVSAFAGEIQTLRAGLAGCRDSPESRILHGVPRIKNKFPPVRCPGNSADIFVSGREAHCFPARD